MSEFKAAFGNGGRFFVNWNCLDCQSCQAQIYVHESHGDNPRPITFERHSFVTSKWLGRLFLGLLSVFCFCHTAYAQAPSIVIQPPSQSSAVGGTIQFTVSATGGGTLAYQWRKNATNLANGTFSGRATVSGATTTAMTLAGVTTNDQANYVCYISNTSGSITSSIASLAIILSPAITTQPKSAATNVGATVFFSVVASGTAPLSYQWYYNGSTISGATLNAYTISGVFTSDAGTYNVRVSNGAGIATSSGAVLAVGNAPVLTSQPSSLVVAQGQTASFNASASGDQPMYYFWRKSGLYIAGATNNTFSIVSAVSSNAASYTFVASNSVGTAISTGAVLTVYFPPSITVQPAGQMVGVGFDFSLSVAAIGNPVLAYQWRKNGSAINGANDSSYIVTGALASDSGIYDVVVSNLVSSLTSSGALVNVVYYPPTITSQPVGGKILAGNNYSLNVTADGTSPLSWQWRKNGVPISGANSNSYVFNPAQLTDAGLYDVVVTNTVGSVTSGVATIYVGYAPVITQQPSSATNAFGSTAVFSCNATGPLPMNYQWFQNLTNLIGQTNSTLILTNLQLQNVGNYLVIVGNAFGNITSSAAILHISPGIVAQPTNQIVMPGTPASFNVSAGGEPIMAYQWQLNGTNLVDNGIYDGSISSNFSLVASLANTVGNYTLVISNSYGSITSSIATLSYGFQAISTFHYTGFIQPYIVPAGVTQLSVFISGAQGGYSSDGVASGGAMQANGVINTTAGVSLLLSVGGSASGIHGGVSPFTGFNGGDGIARYTTGGGGGAATLIQMPDTNYIIVGGSGGGGGHNDGGYGSSPGGSSVLITNMGIVGTNTTGGTAINPSGQGGSGGGGGGGGGAVGGSAGVVDYYTPSGGFGGGSFLPTNYLFGTSQWTFTNFSGANLNGIITIVANPIPFISQQPTSQVAITGSPAQFNIIVSSPTPLFYQWFMNGTPIPNGTNSSLLFSAVIPQNSGAYFMVMTNAYASVTSSVVTLTVNIPAYITAQPQSQTVLQGGNASFTATATGTPPLVYQWQKNGSNLPTATLPTYSIPSTSATDAGSYRVIITNNFGNVTSSIASLSIVLPPQGLTISSLGGNAVQIKMSGTPNFPYAVQSATNLAPPVLWQSLLTNLANTNGVWQFTDTNITVYPQRFYRVTAP